MRWLNEVFFRVPALTRQRVALVYAVAVVTDVLQLILGPFGWAGIDETLDVAAAVATSRLIGFHPLLLPTFILELLPVTDILPTWTGCVALVTALRRRESRFPTPVDNGPVIDVQV
jgi:hypothetical protein